MSQATAPVGGDEVNAICMDIGTYQVKAGYAGEDTPKYVFPSAIGRISDGSNMMDTDGDDANANKNNVKGFFVGTQSLNIRRDNMEITSPFGEHGVLSDWDAVEALWSHAFKDQMRINPEGHPIMMAEPTHNSKAAREKAVELLFEKYKAPAVFLAKNSVLSSFAVGRQTSLVVDCGHNGTTVSAVHDGYVLNKSIVRIPMGGSLLTQLLCQSIESKGTTIHPRYSFKRVDKTGNNRWETEYAEPPNTTDSFKKYAIDAVAAEIKHSICRVSEAPFDPEENANIPTVSYELPDGQEIAVGAARFSVPETLFNPSLIEGFGDAGASVIAAAGGADALQGLHIAVNECINRCDIDIRREFYGGVVLTGGTAMFSTLRDRLEKELTELAPQMAKVRVICPTNTVERRYSSWVGGSILASLGTFQQMWMSRKEYNEHGAGLIHKKAP